MVKKAMEVIDNDYIPTMSCSDRVGLIHDVTSFFKLHEFNIIELDQYVDKYQKRFFMRVQFTPQSKDALKTLVK
jgi:formyltetrahydrofolate hydrolase